MVPQMSTHVEPFGFDRKRLFDLELVGRIFHGEVEVLEQHSCYEQGFLPCKRSSDTT